MTKAELELRVDELEGLIMKQAAEIATMTVAADAQRELLAFTEGMLDLVDQRGYLFYKDWRGYRARSLS